MDPMDPPLDPPLGIYSWDSADLGTNTATASSSLGGWASLVAGVGYFPSSDLQWSFLSSLTEPSQDCTFSEGVNLLFAGGSFSKSDSSESLKSSLLSSADKRGFTVSSSSPASELTLELTTECSLVVLVILEGASLLPHPLPQGGGGAYTGWFGLYQLGWPCECA